MDAFKILEEKVAVLIERLQQAKQEVAHLSDENSRLSGENEQLVIKVKALEDALMVDTERIDKLDQEKTITKMVVDDLIKNIDALVEVDGQ
ncbi:MAG: hypothetical protein M1114_05305 [Candidatus Dependentiae bacterium]|nr:hypothetical protein [Candidatus Dependentiae bacterium]